jgi:hypothetical protein
MTMVGGFDVHRKQITFDYVDDDGLVRWARSVRLPARCCVVGWGKHCPEGDAEFALEGCTGWRYVVEELVAAGVGVHLGDPAETAALRGPTDHFLTPRWQSAIGESSLVLSRSILTISSGPSNRWVRCHPVPESTRSMSVFSASTSATNHRIPWLRAAEPSRRSSVVATPRRWSSCATATATSALCASLVTT